MRSIYLNMILVLLIGCGNDRTSIPQPQPVPSPLRSMIRLSTPNEEQPLMAIVGLPSAVAGAGKVIARNPATEAVRSGIASDMGSFLVVVVDTSTIELSYENDDGTSEPLVIEKMRTLGDPPSLDSTKNPNGQVVSSPDAQGNVTVSDADLLDATPDTDLLVTNATSGEVVADRTDSSGRFSVEIAGSKGDAIYLLLVDPDEKDVTSDFLSYEVP